MGDVIIIKKFKKAVTEVLGEDNIKNYRNEIDEDVQRIMFEIITYDNTEKTCVLLIDINKKSTNKVNNFIKNEFIKEYLRLTEDGTLESEIEEEDSDPQEYCSSYHNGECECENGICDEEEGNMYSTDFYIDEDDNWVWCDESHNDDYCENLEPMDFYNKLSDGSIQFIKEYKSFKFLYEDEEEAKRYID